MLSERSLVLHTTVNLEKLVCSAKCFFSGHAYSVNIVKQFLINSLSLKGFPFFYHWFTKLKTQFYHQFWIFLVSGKNTLLFLNRFFQMFNFVHSCLTNNFIKLGGVLSCVMTFNIILFHHCNCNLTDEAESTLVMWDNKFYAPFTVEYPSFVINFLFFGCRR